MEEEEGEDGAEKDHGQVALLAVLWLSPAPSPLLYWPAVSQALNRDLDFREIMSYLYNIYDQFDQYMYDYD